MHKFKIKLLCNEEEFFFTKTELLNFRLTVPLAKLVMVAAKLVSNSLIFPNDAPVDIQLVSVLSNAIELTTDTKNNYF